MRPINFRGKRIDNGEWVEGFYFVIQDRAKTEHIIMTTDGEGPSMDYPYPQVWHNNIEVDPATVGQFTGLQDKNGVDIFEGDVVRYNSIIEGGMAKIEYFNGGFVFMWDIKTLNGFSAIMTSMMYVGCSDELEITSNSHDTPSEKGE